MNLYEIDQKIMAAFEDAVDMETGEILDTKAYEQLDKLQLMKDQKVEGILLWIKNLSAEAEALKNEKMAFDARQKSTNQKLESLKKYVAGVLAGEKFQTEKVAVSWRKSEAVEYVGDVADLPTECIKTNPEVNKTSLKNLLKNGKVIPGAQLVTKMNIQIK